MTEKPIQAAAQPRPALAIEAGPVVSAAADPVMAAVPCAELLALAHDYERQKRPDDAERMLGYVLAVSPDNAQALHLMGVVAYRKGQIERALALMERAIDKGVDTALFYRNIGELYRVLGRLDEAKETARRSVALSPHDALALMNFGVILAERQEHDAAIDCFERAMQIAPAMASAHFGLAEVLLGKGEFARGWAEYEWRFRIADVPPLMPKTDKPQWNGKAIPDGTLLLIADQGFGDGIQFGRYIKWASALCRNIVLAASAPLKPLLAQIDPAMRVITEWRDVGGFDAWCPLTGLPRLAGTTLESIPADVPYIQPPAARIAHWESRLKALTQPGLRRIGCVWAGRPTHKSDWKRSMTLADLAPVMALDGISLIVLQKGPGQRQTGSYYGRAPLVHLSAEIGDFEDTAAIIDRLDLVLTVDTSVAHLAGAMGKPVWIMLPWAAEWRWLKDRSDSPWYPTARLFRQPAAGNWRAVSDAVATALSEFIRLS